MGLLLIYIGDACGGGGLLATCAFPGNIPWRLLRLSLPTHQFNLLSGVLSKGVFTVCFHWLLQLSLFTQLFTLLPGLLALEEAGVDGQLLISVGGLRLAGGACAGGGGRGTWLH